LAESIHSCLQSRNVHVIVKYWFFDFDLSDCHDHEKVTVAHQVTLARPWLHVGGCLCLRRYILAAGGCHSVIGCRRDDIIYSPLPQYHSVAGMIALAGTMHHGITMVMARKFSASRYWPDCVKYNVTVSLALVERALGLVFLDGVWLMFNYLGNSLGSQAIAPWPSLKLSLNSFFQWIDLSNMRAYNKFSY